MLRAKNESDSTMLKCVRPIVYSTDDDDFRYWGKGTCFLLLYKRQVYVATARHVVDVAERNSLFILPTDTGLHCLPLSSMGWPKELDPDDTDSTDIAMLGVNMMTYDAGLFEGTVALDFPSACRLPSRLKIGEELLVIGMPAEGGGVDYESSKIKATRTTLIGAYTGNAVSSGCHQLTVKDSHSLTDFDGLSGSPVFSRNDAGVGLQFVGMAIRGTASSQKIIFIGSDYFLEFLRLMHTMEPDNMISGEVVSGQ